MSERLTQISGQLPALDPALWQALTSAIRDVAQLETQGLQHPPATSVLLSKGVVVGEDLKDFLSECSARRIDVHVDAEGVFLCERTRSAWELWRVRGQQLQTGFFAAQGEECRRLQALVDAYEQRIAEVDARCRKMVDNLTRTEGA
ncbi:hypothetical protein [Pseudomonas taiwanensis]|uniref:hypothetical protein n=1 Tax=Pseudomonas taiwanensis TaxID=470150 RepID=UPI0028F13362|nr:hypothetical protein [Pseudomonas taiwanensis]